MSLLYIAMLVIEVICGLVLIVLVLLHAPKGEGLGGIGGAAAVFSQRRGAEAGLDKVTGMVAAVFVIVCALLGFGIVRP